MGLRRKTQYRDEEGFIHNFAPKDKNEPDPDFTPFIKEKEIKPPKSVKPLSKKHFQPILEEVKSFKPALDAINSQLTDMKHVLEEMKKIYGNPQINEAPIKEEIEKPNEEIK